MFAYFRLKSLMFAFFEKKYFFPALRLARGNTQQVGASRIFNLRFLILDLEGKGTGFKIANGRNEQETENCRRWLKVEGGPRGRGGFSGGAEPDTRGACAPRYKGEGAGSPRRVAGMESKRSNDAAGGGGEGEGVGAGG